MGVACNRGYTVPDASCEGPTVAGAPHQQHGAVEGPKRRRDRLVVALVDAV
jgi:hypothetical protein